MILNLVFKNCVKLWREWNQVTAEIIKLIMVAYYGEIYK